MTKTSTAEAAAAMTLTIDIFGELNYISYRANRRISPHVVPERWKKIYDNVDEMEARFVAENKSQRHDMGADNDD